VLGHEPRQPGGVDQTEREHVEEMRLILTVERIQLHPHKRLERHHHVVVGDHAFGHVGRGQWIGLANLLGGEEQIDRIAGATVRAVDKAHDVHHRRPYEAGCFERRRDRRKVAAAHEDIDVLRVAHGGPIDAGHPGGHGIAPGHGVGNSGSLEGGGCPQGPITDGLHGFDHSLPGKLTEFDSHWTAFRDDSGAERGCPPVLGYPTSPPRRTPTFSIRLHASATEPSRALLRTQ